MGKRFTTNLRPEGPPERSAFVAAIDALLPFYPPGFEFTLHRLMSLGPGSTDGPFKIHRF